MNLLWERTFEYAHLVADVWRAYLEMEAPIDGPDAPDAGATYTLSDAARTRVEIIDVAIDERLAYTQERPGVRQSTVVTFEATALGARVTITQSGFGTDDDFDVLCESQELGYAEAMQDLAVYLDTGVLERRHLRDRSATGVVFKQTTSGLVVRRVPWGSFGDTAGLRPGDLVVAIDGAAIYGRSDMWLLARTLEPGTEAEVSFVRDGVTLTGRGRMVSTASAVTGELGLGPRLEERVES